MLFKNVLKVEEAVMKKSRFHNLSVTEIHTLESIGQGEAKTMTHVADTLKINVSTLTAAINKLVIKGYVNRFRIPEDRRMVMVELTETGIRAIREHEAFHLIMVKDILSQLSPEESERLIESLENVNKFLLIRLTKNKQKELNKC
jgi:DNA-binding MarR family transcriptional regulator